MVWSPLAGGFLTGKYGRDQHGRGRQPAHRFDFPPVDKERAYDAIDVMREIAGARGVSVAQVALAWLLHQPAVTSVIIGAKKPEQLADNIGATALALDAGELARLDEVSELPAEYPGWMFARQGEVRRKQLADARRPARRGLRPAAMQASLKGGDAQQGGRGREEQGRGRGARSASSPDRRRASAPRRCGCTRGTGWNVVVNFSREAAPAEAVAAECRALGADALVVRADVAADADCRRLAAEVERRFGRADVLVNNAGTTKFVPPRTSTASTPTTSIASTASTSIGAFQMVRALAPMLRASPARRSSTSRRSRR